MAQETARSDRPLRIALEVIALMAVAFVVANLIGIVFLVPLLVLGFDVTSSLVLLGATAIGQFAFLSIGYAYARWRSVRVAVAVPSIGSLLTVAVGVVVALLVAVGLSAVLAALNLVPGSVITDAATSDPTFLLGLAALSIFVVAPAEELLFRGAIQGRLRQRFGPVAAVAGSSLLFGSIHLTNYTGRLAPVVAGALLIACVGAVFGALYEYTENLAVPIAVHAIYNVLLLVVGYLTLSP